MKDLTVAYLKAITVGTILVHATESNADGSPVRAKVNGKPKTWKREPDWVKVPMKYGLKDCFYLGNTQDCHQPIGNWKIPEGGEEYAKR